MLIYNHDKGVIYPTALAYLRTSLLHRQVTDYKTSYYGCMYLYNIAESCFQETKAKMF
jgi:hypothetical protein